MSRPKIVGEPTAAFPAHGIVAAVIAAVPGGEVTVIGFEDTEPDGFRSSTERAENRDGFFIDPIHRDHLLSEQG